MTGRKLIASSVLLALVQIGFLGWMIAGRAAILRDGRDVLLKIEPVDPRDFLRGDYVTLSYDISRIPVKLIADIEPGQRSTQDGPITVRMKKGDDRYWHAVAAWLHAAPPAAQDEVDIVGHIGAGWDLAGDVTIGPDYGIDRFYVPEGEGLNIQDAVRVRPFGVLVAVAKDGTAQIKALKDGDATLFEEPLY